MCFGSAPRRLSHGNLLARISHIEREKCGIDGGLTCFPRIFYRLLIHLPCLGDRALQRYDRHDAPGAEDYGRLIEDYVLPWNEPVRPEAK